MPKLHTRSGMSNGNTIILIFNPIHEYSQEEMIPNSNINVHAYLLLHYFELSLIIFSSCANCISDPTISSISCWKLYCGCHPRLVISLVASPHRASTSE